MAADVKHKMAPNINKMAANMVKMAADVRWCQTCLKTSGVKSRVRVMQINMEEAVVLCENPEVCVYKNQKQIRGSAISGAQFPIEEFLMPKVPKMRSC